MTTIEALERHYATVLAEHEAATVAWVEEAGHRFRFGDKPLCRVLQPFFIDRATYQVAMDAASLLFRGLREIVRASVERGAVGSDRHPRRRALLADSLSKHAFLGGRADMLLTASGPKALEFNPTTADHLPGGVDFSDPLATYFEESEVLREVSKTFSTRPVKLYERLFDAMVAKHVRAGGTGLPTIAEIHVPRREPATASHDDVLPAEMMNLIGYLNSRGIGVQLCPHSDLSYAGGVLTANGARIDIAFLAGASEYLDSCPDDDLLWRAVRDGRVSTACGYPMGNLLHDKALFADLSDPHTNRTLAPDLVEALAAIVPWTRRVEDVDTTFGRAPIRLLDFVRDNRDRLVLKPSVGLGGDGVMLGWETTNQQWLDKLASVVNAGYVVQERVTGGRKRLPYADGGERADGDFFHDFNPYVWGDGVAAGALVRVSQSALLNVSQGTGSIAPVFVVDEP